MRAFYRQTFVSLLAVNEHLLVQTSVGSCVDYYEYVAISSINLACVCLGNVFIS